MAQKIPGEELEALMGELGITRERLAKRAGITDTYLRQLIAGNVRITDSVQVKLYRALKQNGLTMEQLEERLGLAKARRAS